MDMLYVLASAGAGVIALIWLGVSNLRVVNAAWCSGSAGCAPLSGSRV